MKITFSNLPNGELKYLSQAIMQHVGLKTHRGSYMHKIIRIHIHKCIIGQNIVIVLK